MIAPFIAHRVRRRRIAERFHRVGALSADRARPLAELEDGDGRYLRRLQALGLVREAPDGRVYWDESAYAQYQSARRRLALALGVVLVVVGGIAIAMMLSVAR